MTAVTRTAPTAETLPVVRAANLERRRNGRVLWSAQTFDVAAGTSLAITGPSGSGKSTLLNCIGLLDQPDSGTLEIDGVSATSIPRSQRRRLFRTSVGHLFQNYGLVESWTADQNIDVAFTGRRGGRGERERTRRAALERVDLAGYGPRRVHGLSGGEQQRIALARILVKSPRIIVADEPSAALDADNVAMVLSVLEELRAGGAAVFVATHDASVAEWCDREIRLQRAGRSPSTEVSGAGR